MESLRSKKGFICDMDGVIYHGNQLLPGVKEFVEWLQKEEKQFLFLTNASSRSPKELQNKLYRMGLEIGEEHFYTISNRQVFTKSGSGMQRLRHRRSRSI